MATSGLRVLRGSFLASEAPIASNAQCLTLYRVQGPYFGADPADRNAFGDLKRWNDGGLANKQFINVLKHQSAMETLKRVGVATPYAAMTKASVDADALVAIDQDGSMAMSTFGISGLDKQSFWGQATSVAATNSGPLSPPVVARTSNGLGITPYFSR